MLLDVQEQRIYAYPYREFAAVLSENSQRYLAEQYPASIKRGEMLVFVRDNVERGLTSYAVPCAPPEATQTCRQTRKAAPHCTEEKALSYEFAPHLGPGASFDVANSRPNHPPISRAQDPVVREIDSLPHDPARTHCRQTGA